MARGRKLPKVLTPEGQEALKRQFNTRYPSSHRNLCIVRLMLEAGLRAGEVVALSPENVNMMTGQVMVREGKGAKDRVVWIGESLRDLIGAWLERKPVSRWLFPTREGGQLATRYLRQMVKTYAEKAGISELEKVSPHTLRHTFATDFYRETKDIRLTQKALGHEDISTTMVYTHLVDADLEEAMKGFGESEA